MTITTPTTVTPSAALVAIASLLEEFTAATGRHIGAQASAHSWTGDVSVADASIVMFGALDDKSEWSHLVDLRALCGWIGVDPSTITVQPNGRNPVLTVVDAATIWNGVPIRLSALSREWTVAEARAALGLPDLAGGES